MDKSGQSSGDSTTNSGSSSTTNGRDQYLKHLNKLSHKISKSSSIKKPALDHPDLIQNQNFNLNQTHPQPQSLSSSQPPANVQSQQQSLPPQHQPPVYNINKSDFRDVVQKLTGSPAHERISNPPPIHPPKPQSSRLQRIRPPPLAHLSNRPPTMLNSGMSPATNPNIPIATTASTHFGSIGRPAAPLSPLPPLPTVHAAAESPVSAYMRYLHNSISSIDPNLKQFSGFSPLAPLVSPRWTISASQQLQQQQEMIRPPPTSTMIPSHPQIPMPPSPLPFGCLNSPRSPYPLLSPNLPFSPAQSGFSQLPLSPTVPLPSPKWRAL